MKDDPFEGVPPVRDPIRALSQNVAARRRGRPEVWTFFAFAIVALTVLLIIYLGLRPGGSGPVLAYSIGRDLLGLAALATAFVGLMWSVLHRPLIRRYRLPAFLGLAAVIGSVGFPFPYPSSHEGHPSQTCFRLPVRGEWTVMWGGETKRTNLLAGYFPDRRWGIDLIVTREGKSYAGEGLALIDYFAYGQPVLAPCDGRVVTVRDGLPDTQPGMFERGVEPFGNHLVIEVAEEEFLFLAHLKPNTIEVQPGQEVRIGDLLAEVGNSGFSTVTPQPHLALHLQDTPLPKRGEAVPWSFCHYTADGLEVEGGLPRGGISREGVFLGERVESLAR